MDTVEQIKNRLNLADFIREYIELKKAGANWKALCPFHSEKTPSFMVSEEKQIWHCFGCSEGGDIFGFLMRMEGIDFAESLRLLAKRAGVFLEKVNPALNSQKSKLLDTLEEAAKFYQNEYQLSPLAQNYFKERGLGEEIISQFRLGFAPQNWDKLFLHLQNKNFRPADIVLAGLAVEKEGGGFYDRFRGRVIFPIFNLYGNVLGFTARILPQLDDGEMGKYINSPETLVYKKSQILYGLNFARQEIKKEGAAIIVEGNMDVISLHQAGFRNVAAASGTALTPEQVDLLSRYTKNIIISFDADDAGKEAAGRGIDVALSRGFNVKVLEMPKDEEGGLLAKDPDELVRKSPGLWQKMISDPKHIINFFIENSIFKYDLSNPYENSLFCETVLKEIQKIKNSVEKALWIKKLSNLSGVDERDLRERIVKIRPGKNETSPNKIITRDQKTEEIKKMSGLEEAELKFLSFLFIDINRFADFLWQISPEMFKNQDTAQIYRHLLLYYNEKKTFKDDDFKKWFLSLGQNEILLDKILLFKDKDLSDDSGLEDVRRELVNLVLRMKNNYLKEKRKFLEQEMKAAEELDDKEKISQILEKFKELN